MLFPIELQSLGDRNIGKRQDGRKHIDMGG